MTWVGFEPTNLRICAGLSFNLTNLKFIDFYRSRVYNSKWKEMTLSSLKWLMYAITFLISVSPMGSITSSTTNQILYICSENLSLSRSTGVAASLILLSLQLHQKQRVFSCQIDLVIISPSNEIKRHCKSFKRKLATKFRYLSLGIFKGFDWLLMM